MWRKTKDAPPAVTHGVPGAARTRGASAASQATHDEIERLRERVPVLPLAPGVPRGLHGPGAGDAGDAVDPATGWSGGFSCVLGNPPWDKVDFEDKKYFSVVEPTIAAIAGTARRTRIVEWEAENANPSGERYRTRGGWSSPRSVFAGSSGAFPLCAKGLTVKGVNSAPDRPSLRGALRDDRRAAGPFRLHPPDGHRNGAASQYLFSDFTQRGAVASLYDFENRKPLFVGVDSRYKFCLLSLVGRDLREPAARFAFFLETRRTWTTRSGYSRSAPRRSP